MIILDTHIWIWWVHDDPSLKSRQRELLQEHESKGLGVSVISCWEVAKLIEYKRLILPCSADEWFEKALSYPGILLLDLTPRIALESTRLPKEFHKDPADQMIVATSKIYDAPLLTADTKILSFSDLNLLR